MFSVANTSKLNILHKNRLFSNYNFHSIKNLRESDFFGRSGSILSQKSHLSAFKRNIQMSSSGPIKVFIIICIKIKFMIERNRHNLQ